MNGNKPSQFARIRETVAEYRKQIVQGVIVSVIIAALGWGWIESVDYFETKPFTIALSPDVAGETTILPVFEIVVRPALDERCARPKWLAWIAEHAFEQRCLRLSFEPHELERMITRRVPYKLTANLPELLDLFVEHHKGCLSLRRENDKIVIEETKQSQLIRMGDRLICP